MTLVPTGPRDILDRIRRIEHPMEVHPHVSWIPPTLVNSWANFGGGYAGAKYKKDSLGYVMLRGMIAGGTINLACFLLPEGFRPSERLVFPTISNNVIGRVDILADGQVIPVVGNNTYVTLEGIRFAPD